MKKTIVDIRNAKGKEKIAALTAYDFQTASMLDTAGIDVLLVGDSIGNIVYGFENTLSMTMDIMVAHTRAVSRATKSALVVGDMPFGSYQPSEEVALKNAIRFISQGQAQAVKLEGGLQVADTVKKMVDYGIPVMGHVGLTPQSVNQLGGFRMQGKVETEADRIRNDALALEKAGVFAVVFECIDAGLAKELTERLSVPTIGIGSGESCDGQILVTNDLLGYTVGHVPKFVKQLANLNAIVTETTAQYVRNVKEPKK